MNYREQIEKLAGMQNMGQLGCAAGQAQMANQMRPAGEIEQHFHRLSGAMEDLNARISNLRDALGSVLAETGPECAVVPNQKDPPVMVSCATSDKLATMHRQIDAMAYEVQGIIVRLRL
jgi:hypothetical protein